LEREASTIATLVEEAARQAEIHRQKWEIERQKWRREEEERRQARALKESKEELFSIIEAWAEAKRIEEFFKDAELRAAELNDDVQHAILNRLKEAREMLGGIDALQRFLSWKTPKER
jgi:GTP1/Obg family GTP-binding protein